MSTDRSESATAQPDPDDAPYALLLTHDVDRPYKTYQSLYYALTGESGESRRYHLSTLRPGTNPYWQFESVMALEQYLGVRSAFYFLNEQSLFRDRPVREWLTMTGWMRYAGRYELTDPNIQALIERLDDNGWEIGLHGSFDSYDNRERLQAEKAELESVLGCAVEGVRQHHLNLTVPDTWEHHRSLGLQYDTSLGSSASYGFDHGYGIQRPFDDEFVVFPLTVMEQALPDPADDFDRAWAACRSVLAEAEDNSAVVTVLWHPRHFHPREFPGYPQLYRRLVEHALDDGAWVGSPGEFYEQADLATDSFTTQD